METVSNESCSFPEDSTDTSTNIKAVQLATESVKISNSKIELEQKILELTLHSESLENENKRLQEENVMLRRRTSQQLESFASMVHELRTPLSCIVCLTDLLLLDDIRSSIVLRSVVAAANDPSSENDSSSENNSLSSEQRESIQLIASSCGLLRSVVDDVLDFSKLESGNIHVQLRQVNAKYIVKNVIDTCTVHGKQTRNVSIHTKYINEDIIPVPEYIETDSRLLSQIMFNLLGNAIKFSRQFGTIDVTISTESTCNSDSNPSIIALTDQILRISVKDYGKGIEKEQIQRIFQPFHQVNCVGSNELNPDHNSSQECSASSSNVTYKSHDDRGTGLGLSIANTIVTALGGTLTVDSELGCWSEFTVLLPIRSTSQTTESIETSNINQHSLIDTPLESSNKNEVELNSSRINTKLFINSPNQFSLSNPSVNMNIYESRNKYKVLIAEDNLINQKVLHRVLKKIGINDIDIVNNGKEAVEITLHKHYDVIFMDIQMPIMDGFEATREIVSRNKALMKSKLQSNISTSDSLVGSKVTTTTTTKTSSSTDSVNTKRPSPVLYSLMDNDPQIPVIIFLSAHASESFKDMTLEVGGNGFISKPFYLPQIQNIFDNLS